MRILQIGSILHTRGYQRGNSAETAEKEKSTCNHAERNHPSGFWRKVKTLALAAVVAAGTAGCAGPMAYDPGARALGGAAIGATVGAAAGMNPAAGALAGGLLGAFTTPPPPVIVEPAPPLYYYPPYYVQPQGAVCVPQPYGQTFCYYP